MKEFTNLYSLSKTLRFELIPQGKTLENIQKKGLINQDYERSLSYQKMKKTIDEFHKYFIEIAMSNVKLTSLKEYANLYYTTPDKKKEESFVKKIEEAQTVLRKEIVKGFKTGDANAIFSKLDKKELVKDILEDWIQSQKDVDIYFDEGFKNFTTYFGGFHKNRKNMYSDEAHSTAIAFRLIHENLPKFLDNIKNFDRIKNIPELYKNTENLYKEIEEYLNIMSIDKAFELDYYNEVLTQRDIDVYNLIVGGRTAKEGEKKIKGLNEYINLYNQKQDKKNRIPKFKQLYKQILSDRENISFLPENFENSQEVLDAIENYYKANLLDFKPDDKKKTENILVELKSLLVDLKTYDINKIYIRNDKAITDISKKLFDDWSIIKSALEFSYLSSLKIGSKGLTKTQEKAKDAYLKQSYFSIAEIEKALVIYKNEVEVLINLKESDTPVADYFYKYFKTKKKEESDKEFDFIANIEAKYSCIKGLLNMEYPSDKRLHQDQKNIDNIKLFLDSLMELLHFVKPLAVPSDNPLEKDNNFYGHFEPFYEQLRLMIPLYNKVRNYASQKPYSTKKFKLNFENAQLLGGWDANKEKDYLTSILRDNGNYYLAIMDKHNNKVLQNIENCQGDTCYEKMVYKLLPGVNKMLPKVFFSKKNIEYFNPSSNLLDKYKKGTHKKGNTFSLEDCHYLIDFFKTSLNKHEDWKHFNFSFSPTTSYKDTSDFYREVSNQGYKITFEKVSKDYIYSLVEDSKLYLFQIYNKDFSPYSKGKPNLHTLYWKALFDEENLKNVVYKLNGQAELFYRKKSIEEEHKIVHKAKQPILNKNPKATKKESKFEYAIVKDKRYTVDKFQFHVPITMNFKASGNDFINYDVLNFLKNNPDVNIIGLDRGERHLIYLTLIDQKGNILKQESLNKIVNNKFNIETNYHQLLDKKETERDKARKNWGVIENIKELKTGYLSQIIHKIATMMLEHNAIVVMEDLNFGFKRGRFKVEKQIYQKLEKMLIDKLNYLVFKDKEPEEIGGLYNALQLTNKFISFEKMGKQSGFLFYVPAWMTSKIDPTTGFVNLLYPKYENIEKAQSFFSKFKSIRFNPDNNYFEFHLNYNDFTDRAKGTKTEWTICTHGDRIITFRNPDTNNQWDNKEINLTQEFEKLLGKVGVLYGDGSNIKAQIITQNDASFFKAFFKLMKLTLQMRNSITGTDIDYLISPVKNSNGVFYDSRIADKTLPKDADANGAYHIALKGLQWMEQIQQFDGEDWKKLDLDKTNKAWLNFIQNKK